MKKIYLLFFLATAFACTNPEENTKPKIGLLSKPDPKSHYYEMIVEGTDGVDSLIQVKFQIHKFVVDSLKITEHEIRVILSSALIWSDFEIENKRTYRFNNLKDNYLHGDSSSIYVTINGICSNSYGVDYDVITYLWFDKKGNFVLSEAGLSEGIERPLMSTFIK